jgi:putative tricarboxylic transport membrane protein
MGLFGVAEILSNLEQELKREVIKARIGGLWPSLADWAASKWPIVRGTVLGFFLGILPGGGRGDRLLCQLRAGEEGVAHARALRQRRDRRRGRARGRQQRGGRRGLHPADDARHSANVVMALLLGAFIIHGLQPGPLMMTQNPGLFWGIVASMYIGNVMLLVLNMPLIGMWVQVLKLPYRVMFPLILMFCSSACSPPAAPCSTCS